MEKLLNIQDLMLRFYTYEGVVKALEGVNLYVKKGETLGLVGETGCGKTMTGLSILFLIPSPGKIEGGSIFFKSKHRTLDLLSQDESILRSIRGKDIAMIFQEPSSALNPLFTVEDQISEVLLHHRREELAKKALEGIDGDLQSMKGGPKGFIYGFERKIYKKMVEKPHSLSMKLLSRIPIIRRYQRRLKKEARKEVVKILGEMEIPDPERVADMYPHELSGGMQQRVVIAMALACNPTLLIADEPTTNLDVTIQAQILNLTKKLKKEFGSSILYITHDMGVIAEMCDRVAVMYAGSVCEIADVIEIFKNPIHPYTKALLESIPRPGKEFKSIIGMV
ncbi:ATP-binding cassette domain-containing protein, partial [Candidatus Bathyarchaeota archaeon]|nr:ATP-binding cassette domain-containing protein [Candidatus Bathyarchaeota archaeon]